MGVSKEDKQSPNYSEILSDLFKEITEYSHRSIQMGKNNPNPFGYHLNITQIVFFPIELSIKPAA